MPQLFCQDSVALVLNSLMCREHLFSLLQILFQFRSVCSVSTAVFGKALPVEDF